MDHKQGDDPAWYEQQDDPPLLNSDFDLCGDYHHRIVYKSDLTSDMYTPTGRVLVHENNVFFDAPGMKHLLMLTTTSTMALTSILRQLPTVVSSRLMLITMSAV
jgi:hypothetical protein